MMASSKIKVLENLCRTCMGEQYSQVKLTASREKANLISIYHEQETNDSGNVKIIELLKQTSPQLTVETDDMLPKIICENCLDMLVNVHEFQQNAFKVEQRLRDFIKEYNSQHEIVVDPLNMNEVLIKVETEEPVIDATATVKGFFSLLQKDGEIIEVYNELEKCDGETSGWSKKCNNNTEVDDAEKGIPEFDADASQVRSNKKDTQSDVKCRSIEGDHQSSDPVKKEQNNKGEVNDPLRPKRKSKRLDIKTRTFKRSKREIEKAEVISDESNNQQQTTDDDEDSDADNELLLQPVSSKSNGKQEITEEDSLESKVLNFNETSGDNDSEWEPPSDKSKWFKSKSINTDSKLEQENSHVKSEDDKTFKLDTRGFYCNKCGKCLKTRLTLKTHLKKHLRNEQKQHKTDNGHNCPECGLRLKTRVTFRRHLLLHDKDVQRNKTPYLCSICGKSYATQGSLKEHYVRHGTEFNYQCPHCPKRFRCSSSVSTHKAIVHTKLKPHVCDVCGASFKKPYALTKHKIIHGEKKHKCDYCEMKFAQTHQCRRHMRTHTGEKPYKCRYCERAYAQSNDMIKHLRVHLGDNVYRCEMCPQAFRLLCEMRVHFTSHKDDDEQTKIQNLKALKEEEERIQAKIEKSKLTEQQS